MNLDWNKKQDLQEIKSILDKDKVLLISSDTVLGLHARLTQEGYEQLNMIKKRSQKPYLTLIPSVVQLFNFIDQTLSTQVQQLITLCWPGPVTLIFKAKKELPGFLKSSDNTIALRVPDHEGLRQILQFYEGLFSTSANIHGQPIPQTLDEVSDDILRLIGGISVDQNQGVAQSPSSIIDCTSYDLKVLRKGEGIESILGKIQK